MIRNDRDLLIVAIGLALIVIAALGLFSWKVIPLIAQERALSRLGLSQMSQEAAAIP